MSSEPLSVLMAPGPLPADQAVRILRNVAASLHDVHGELFPSAIFLDGDEIEIHPPGHDRAYYGQYAAPERILGKPATPASDVFSLGAILFHALAGHPPFRGDNASAVMLAVCTESPLALPSQVPHALDVIVQRCLHKDPVQRFRTPAALCEALTTYTNREVWQGKRILAVDDDMPIRVLYARMATRLGIEADIVATGRDAVEALKTRRYDVVLLDLNLPRISGWEVLDFLRTREPARPRKLYVVTGFADQHISEADRDLVSAVLYKPVELEELSALVTASLGDAPLDLSTILRTTQHRAVA